MCLTYKRALAHRQTLRARMRELNNRQYFSLLSLPKSKVAALETEMLKI